MACLGLGARQVPEVLNPERLDDDKVIQDAGTGEMRTHSTKTGAVVDEAWQKVKTAIPGTDAYNMRHRNDPPGAEGMQTFVFVGDVMHLGIARVICCPARECCTCVRPSGVLSAVYVMRSFGKSTVVVLTAVASCLARRTTWEKEPSAETAMMHARQMHTATLESSVDAVESVSINGLEEHDVPGSVESVDRMARDHRTIRSRLPRSTNRRSADPMPPSRRSVPSPTAIWRNECHP